LPAPFSFSTNPNSMVPEDGSIANSRREAHINLGTVTVTT